MEEKKGIKVNLTTLLLCVTIIILVIVGCFVYNWKTIEKLNAKIDSLEKAISNTEGSSNDLIEDTEKSKKENIEYIEISEKLEGIDVLYVTDAINNDDNTYTLKGVVYTQYTLSYEEIQASLKTGKMKLENQEYTIKYDVANNVYELYKLYELEDDNNLYTIKHESDDTYYITCNATIEGVWKLTDEYREITVGKDIEVMGFNESLGTVEEVFKNWEKTVPLETSNPDSAKVFNFNFENGECVEVVQDHLTCM